MDFDGFPFLSGETILRDCKRVPLRSSERVLVARRSMPINPHNPFKGRQFPGEVIVLCVRWYLRYPLSYQHVTELVAERGVGMDASCIWRWVQAYAPELNNRCRPHLKPTNKSYRIHETYIKVQGEDKYLYRALVRQVRRSVFY